MKRFMMGALACAVGSVLGLSGCSGSDAGVGTGSTGEPAPTTSPAAGAATSAASGSAAAISASAGASAGSTPGSAPKGSPGGSDGSAAGSAGTTANGLPSASIPRELCIFLAREAPLLKKTGSKEGALARFAVDYAGWIAEDPNRKLANAAELDAITTSTCPKIRAQALKALRGKSFVALLGG